MDLVRWIGCALGVVVVLWTGAGVIRTLIVPRGLQSLLPRVLARTTQKAFLFVARRFDTYEARDRLLAFQAPTFLLTLLGTWIVLFLIGYGLILWPIVESFPQALL